MPELPPGEPGPAEPQPPELPPLRSSAAGGPAPTEQPADQAGRRRSPGWREVLLIAAAVVAAVFALEIATGQVPALREAFVRLPLTIVVLIGGTLIVLVLAARGRRGRPRT